MSRNVSRQLFPSTPKNTYKPKANSKTGSFKRSNTTEEILNLSITANKIHVDEGEKSYQDSFLIDYSFYGTKKDEPSTITVPVDNIQEVYYDDYSFNEGIIMSGSGYSDKEDDTNTGDNLVRLPKANELILPTESNADKPYDSFLDSFDYNIPSISKETNNAELAENTNEPNCPSQDYDDFSFNYGGIVCGGALSSDEDDVIVVAPEKKCPKTPKPTTSSLTASQTTPVNSSQLVNGKAIQPNNHNDKRKAIENMLTMSSVLDKIGNITPKPAYEKMAEDELNRNLKLNGLAKCGKKKAIGLLNRIYEQNHPVVMLDQSFAESPKARKRKHEGARLEKICEESEESDDSESSFNSSFNDNSLCPNPEFEPDYCEFPKQVQRAIPKTKEQYKTIFIKFIRLPENEAIYICLLRGEVITLDEIWDLVRRSIYEIRKISKAMLMQVLDSLTLPCKLPDESWKSKPNRH
uniref:RPAP1_N domain-containing protein n=1 Tax=Rhabditophanes sp. KR3021 TaxID=114890 RepID=A0AC35TNE0_9BILA